MYSDEIYTALVVLQIHGMASACGRQGKHLQATTCLVMDFHDDVPVIGIEVYGQAVFGRVGCYARVVLLCCRFGQGRCVIHSAYGAYSC